MTNAIQPLLWPDGVPGGLQTSGVPAPTLTAFMPPAGTANGASVIVCPGGGYVVLADHEADPVARWLTTLGITAFVLRYRLAPAARHPHMLEDAARAVRTVRAHASGWGLDPARIGVLGFSAGGHLCSMLATHFDAGEGASPDPVERVSSRPDLAILVYPVITLQGPHGHPWCRQCLLGEHPDPAQVAHLSSEMQVAAQTPPMFLVHTADDDVSCQNSLLMAQALSVSGVPFELHLYEKGGHGYGLAENDPILRTWPARCAEWLHARNFLKPVTS